MATTVFPKPSGWASATEDIPFNIPVSDWTAVTGGYQAEIVNSKFNATSIELVTYTISVAEYLTANISKDKDAANNKLIFFTASLPTGPISGNICCINNLSTSVSASEKGVANGVATLDGNGLIPSNQLPGYVDDVQEYLSQSAFPATGEIGKIYVATDTNKSYRWSGTTYVELSSYALATDSAAGLMSATDKSKLDGIAAGATANVVSNSLTDTSTTNALSAAQGKALNDKIENVDETTAISNLLNIPVNSQGRIRLAASISPTGTESIFDYHCFGYNNHITLKVSHTYRADEWINYYNENAWSGWVSLNSNLANHDLGNQSSLTNLDSAIISALGSANTNNSYWISFVPTFGGNPGGLQLFNYSTYTGYLKKFSDTVAKLIATDGYDVMAATVSNGSVAWQKSALNGKLAKVSDIYVQGIYSGNLNDISETCVRYCNPSSTNRPAGQSWGLIYTWCYDTNTAFQLFISNSGDNGEIFSRIKQSSGWQSWLRYALNDKTMISDGTVTEVQDLSTSGVAYNYTATEDGYYTVRATTANTSGDLLARIMFGNTVFASVEIISAGQYDAAAPSPILLKSGTTIKCVAIFPSGGDAKVIRIK